MSGIPQGFKPNLAATLTKPELIKFPVWASPKIDGIRCVIFDGVAYSRSLKPIPNPFVQQWVRDHADELDALDGELVVGSPTDPNCMQHTTSGVMKKSGEPDFAFYVFDIVPPAPLGFEKRTEEFDRWCELGEGPDSPRVHLVTQHLVNNLDELTSLETQFLAQGYEGMTIRSPDGAYKFGRSTEREGGLVKVKRFTDAEATVIGFEEEMHNANEAKCDALGRTERSTSKAGLHGKGTLGALVVKNDKGVVFNIGTGFTSAQRADYWANHPSLFGKIVKFKHFDHGTVDAPRHPVFICFRHPEDM
ncbi:ATP-dependent DNA ligase [Burkholderia ubonensis]|uniref:ATP-dependent DNA ligase n=1 Tax=Burkholderia ubonensis TaxID=101571 RepID=UPI0007529BAC|nr:ATP-dependent DNA ligase [Burkholderia ubonensis]KVU18573.1 ATP-dependent DNA ligase [Burkholderia ubonensis]